MNGRAQITRSATVLTLACLLFATGCYASVGPTIGYKTGDGVTVGAEVDGSYYIFAHGGAGLSFRKAREDDKDTSSVATTYAYIGPGLTAPPSYPEGRGCAVMTGIGAAHDRESDTSFLWRLGGGPMFDIRPESKRKDSDFAGLVFGLQAGITYWNGGVQWHLSPQVGVASILGYRAFD